jgi:hypothetical protein
MPRPARKKREKANVPPLILEKLLYGYWTGGRSLCPSDTQLSCYWESCREQIMKQKGQPEGFALGTAPWAFWVFDVGLRGFPESQAERLHAMGLLAEAEKACVIAAARERLQQQVSRWSEAKKETANCISDSELFAAWPGLPDRVWQMPRKAISGGAN